MNILYFIGTVLAVILSWSTFGSFPWACLAGFFNWFYVLYWVVFYNG